MLSDERIRELARGTYRADSVDDACEEAIRLAVAETAEACAVECDNLAYASRQLPDGSGESASIARAMSKVLDAAAAAIREKAKEKK